MVDWNAPNLYYLLWYRKRGSADWLPEKKFTDPNIDKFSVLQPGYYVPWEFQIQAVNEHAPGPKSPIEWSYSGQDPPAGRPEDVKVGAVGPRSVELSWKPVTVDRGSVDGYRVSWLSCLYTKSILLAGKCKQKQLGALWHDTLLNSNCQNQAFTVPSISDVNGSRKIITLSILAFAHGAQHRSTQIWLRHNFGRLARTSSPKFYK